MATNSRHARDPRRGEGTAAYPMVDRRLSSVTGLESEPFEYLRDALKLESRLRVDPPGEWRSEETGATERSWTGYGSTVRLHTPSVLGDWTLTVDGEDVLADVSRRRAFEVAAQRMREISEQTEV